MTGQAKRQVVELGVLPSLVGIVVATFAALSFGLSHCPLSDGMALAPRGLFVLGADPQVAADLRFPFHGMPFDGEHSPPNGSR